MFVEMDSSWIELPNDNPDYLDGVVKFIKLAKENLVEGRTRCPCRRCKVDKYMVTYRRSGATYFIQKFP